MKKTDKEHLLDIAKTLGEEDKNNYCANCQIMTKHSIRPVCGENLKEKIKDV